MALSFSGIFQGKRVLVTGAGSGIGRALTIRLDQEGAIVVAVTLKQVELDSLTQETSKRIIPVCLDVGDWDGVRTTLAPHLTESLDILVNNAGVAPTQPFLEVTKNILDTTLDINFKAVVNITQICAQNMVSHGKGGCIVNVSSVAGIVPLHNSHIYGATKAAIDSLTKNLSLELGKHKIRAVSLTLGPVDTPLARSKMPTDEIVAAVTESVKDKLHLGELFVPMEEVVNSILFVASGKVHMMTGCRLVLDGGWSNS